MAIAEGIMIGSAVLGTGLKYWDYIQNRDLRKIQNEVFMERATWNKDLLRRARGKFTDSELADIARQNQPALTQLSGNVSARLGPSSGVAADILSQAQQQTLFNAQNQAASLAGGVGATGGGGSGQPQSPSFLASIAQIAATMQSMRADPNDDIDLDMDNDGTIIDAVDIIQREIGKKQGYQLHTV